MSGGSRKAVLAALGLAALALAGCSPQPTSSDVAADVVVPAGAEIAIFAGGCFWCMEPPFDGVDGVYDTTSGYTGGTTVDPTYHEVAFGGTGHAEAVRVIYDPTEVDYQTLLDVYWQNVDPLDAGGQFCDRGDAYRTAIFVLDDDQRRLAETSKETLMESRRFDRPIVTEIVTAGTFYPAEERHQNYEQKNPLRYSFYRRGCGRDARLGELWAGAVGD